ncbi:MAG: hypothetical protein ACRCYU_07270 [Nocardioides sp.]
MRTRSCLDISDQTLRLWRRQDMTNRPPSTGGADAVLAQRIPVAVFYPPAT